MDTPSTLPLAVSPPILTAMQEVLSQLFHRAAEIDPVETHRALLSVIDRRNVP
jgi:hypothetical protein